MDSEDKPWVKTSLVELTDSIEDAPCRIFIKNEYLQPSGSFKLRGLGHLIASSIVEAKTLNKSKIHVFSSSGGNAGLAAAYASRFYKVPCTVVLPKTSKPVVIDKLKGFNARVEIHGNHWGEADEYLRNHVMKEVPDNTHSIYSHPFDLPLVWQGHGIIMDEIVTEKQLSQYDLEKVVGVVCSVGGGGLYNGIVEGLERNGEQLSKVPILAVETKQCPTFHEAVKANKKVTLTEISTIVSSLASPYLSEKALHNYHNHPTKLGLIDDIDAVRATLNFFDKYNVFIEPSCGATLHYALNASQLVAHFGPLAKDEIVIFIGCGGSGVNSDILEDYRKLTK